jgi:hypothetical protein
MPMSRRQPDRALRGAVAGLARLHPDDVEAILGALDPAEKARVDVLVAGLAGRVATENPPEAQPEWVYESVSPWLLTRIDPDDRRSARAGREFMLITDASREALRAAAEPFRKQVTPAARNGMALLDQVWRLFARRRA